MRKVDLTDHEFAKYLRKRNAINGFKHVPGSSMAEWFDVFGTRVAVVMYNNADSTRIIYLDNED